MMIAMLESLRDALASIPGVKTCRIGLEENITPDDYPIIRLVPIRMADGIAFGWRRVDLLIYFGLPIQPFDDAPDEGGRVRLEKLYSALFRLEASIREKLALQRGVYRETIADEDRIETYKMMAIRAELEG